MPDFVYNFIDFWSTPVGIKTFLFIKYFLIFVSLFFAFWIVFLLKRSSYLWQFQLYKETLRKGALTKGKIPKKWQEILSKIETPEEANHKLAIIEADALVDGILKEAGYAGVTMTERIEKITPVQLKTISELRRAHSIRKNILYNPNYKLTPQAVREVINLYEEVLKELDVI